MQKRERVRETERQTQRKTECKRVTEDSVGRKTRETGAVNSASAPEHAELTDQT